MYFGQSVVRHVKHDIMLKERVARNMWSGWEMIVSWIEVILAVMIVILTYQSWPIVAGGLVLLGWQRISSHIVATKSAILFQLSWKYLIKQIKSLNWDLITEFEILQNVFPFTVAYQIGLEYSALILFNWVNLPRVDCFWQCRD